MKRSLIGTTALVTAGILAATATAGCLPRQTPTVHSALSHRTYTCFFPFWLLTEASNISFFKKKWG